MNDARQQQQPAQDERRQDVQLLQLGTMTTTLSAELTALLAFRRSSSAV